MKVRSASEARESGFYWIKDGHEWVIGEWDADRSRWTLTGTSEGFNDEEFDEIDERKIVRST